MLNNSNATTTTSSRNSKNSHMWLLIIVAILPIFVEGSKVELEKHANALSVFIGVLILFAIVICPCFTWYFFFRSPFYVLPCKSQDTRTSYMPSSWTFDDVPERITWIKRSPRKAACMDHKKNYCEKCQEDYTIMNLLSRDQSYAGATNDKDYRMDLVQSAMIDCYTEGTNGKKQKKDDNKATPKARYDETLHHMVWRLLKETEDPVMVVSGFAGFCFRLPRSSDRSLDEPMMQLADKATQELLHIRESPEAVEQTRRMYGWSTHDDEEAVRRNLLGGKMARDHQYRDEPTETTNANIEHEA